MAAKAQRARQLAADRQRSARVTPPVPSTQPSSKWPHQGRGAMRDAGKDLIDPSCVLGPAELCDALADLIIDCDAGDASDCLAVGQFLADTPPRPLIAITFFLQACRIGDPTGCERLDALKEPPSVPCAEDPFACGWWAYRSNDAALLDEACTQGVGDACAARSHQTHDDIGRARSYLESACQHGNPMTCMELAHRLSADCVPDELRSCYPPDAAQARAALEIACSAGWDLDGVCERGDVR